MTQRDRIQALLKLREGQWVPLKDKFGRGFDIAGLGIMQYNARIHELRRRGMIIDCKEEIVDGQKHTYYRYRRGETQETLG